MSADFESLGVTRQFRNALEDLGIEKPTEIQELAIPPINGGQDVIGIAPTGTGKSAAYLLPLLMKLKYAKGEAPRALILVPTKELVVQVTEQVRQLATYTDLRCVGLYGGIGPKNQMAELAVGVDIVVATPGRFLDIYRRNGLNARKISTLVLDEADRMMEMGFMDQLRNILEVIPVKRQNLLFSATFADRVVELSHEFLEFPTRIEVSPQATAVETVEQKLYYVPNFRTKLTFLEYLLHQPEFERVLLFCRTKELAEQVSHYLDRKTGISFRVLHGNKGQNSRINAVKDFGSGIVKLLVCTDVAARGLDIPKVSHVINFNIPVHYDDYVHRIGRTGRAYQAGVAISICDPTEERHIALIENLIREQIPVFDLPAEVPIRDPLPGELKKMAREIDLKKQQDDPNYKGAFHKRKPRKRVVKKKSSGKKGKGKH